MSDHPVKRPMQSISDDGFEVVRSESIIDFGRPSIKANNPPSEPDRKHKAHENGASCVTFSFDGKKIVTGGCDGTVKLWETVNSDFISV